MHTNGRTKWGLALLVLVGVVYVLLLVAGRTMINESFRGIARHTEIMEKYADVQKKRADAARSLGLYDLAASAEEDAASAQAGVAEVDASRQEVEARFQLCVFVLGLSYVCGILGYAMGARKGSPGAGALWGLLVGPLGVAVVAVMRGTRVKCPHCAELMLREAKVCFHCGRGLGTDNAANAQD